MIELSPATVEKVLCHLLRFGSSRADAEDLAQEALLVAWRERASFDPARSLDAWLYGIARNMYRNHARRRQREPIDRDHDATIGQTTSSTIGDVLLLQRALQALPEDQQDIVILHELEGRTLKETASLLAIPFDTAKDRLRRARRSLEAACGSNLETIVAEERPATTRMAKAAVASVLAGVLAGIGRPAAATAGVIASKTAALWLAGALVSGVVIGAVGQRMLGQRVVREPAVASVVAPEPASSPPIAPPATAPSSSTPTSIAPPASTPRAPIPAPVVSNRGDIAAETKLVEDARAALHSGRPNDAIASLRLHVQRFAAGQLAEERDLLWIEAAITIDDRADAARRIASFRSTYPTTMHTERLDALATRL
jgi:RNA polymerase sigma factor (sigma-70 family)